MPAAPQDHDGDLEAQMPPENWTIKTGEVIEDPGNYDDEILRYKENLKIEADKREKRIEKASGAEKSWEMMRELKQMIKKHSRQWKENEELRNIETKRLQEEKNKEKEKDKRIKMARKKKQNLLTDLKIEKNLKELSVEKRNEILEEEKKIKRL